LVETIASPPSKPRPQRLPVSQEAELIHGQSFERSLPEYSISFQVRYSRCVSLSFSLHQIGESATDDVLFIGEVGSHDVAPRPIEVKAVGYFAFSGRLRFLSLKRREHGRKTILTLTEATDLFVD
jgi:hypothetical protein